VARYLGAQDLVNYGIASLEVDVHMYPTIRRIINELRQPVVIQTPQPPQILPQAPVSAQASYAPLPEAIDPMAGQPCLQYPPRMPNPELSALFDTFIPQVAGYTGPAPTEPIQNGGQASALNLSLADYMMESTPYSGLVSTPVQTTAEPAQVYWS